MRAVKTFGILTMIAMTLASSVAMAQAVSAPVPPTPPQGTVYAAPSAPVTAPPTAPGVQVPGGGNTQIHLLGQMQTPAPFGAPGAPPPMPSFPH
jgi:Spy/CpxP family protein refolding chaperone